MNKIVFPLQQRMRGEAVADLQDGLRLLMDQGVLGLSDSDRQALAERLPRERAQSTYGAITRRLVGLFQEQRRLQPSGVVDEQTAAALNALLEELGAFPREVPDQRRLVGGQVRREDGQPFPGAPVRALHAGDRGTLRLGEDTTDAEGRYTIHYGILPGVGAIHLRVVVLDADSKPLVESDVIRAPKPVEIVDLVAPVSERPSAPRRLEGRILFDRGLPAENVTLRLYRHGFGGAETLLGETTTRTHGLYALPFNANGAAASLEVRALDAEGQEISLSTTLYDRGDGDRAAVNLVAPSALRPLAAEYERLQADLTPHVGDMNELATAREDAERQDLTVLNRATGWDARLIALAAHATALSAEPEMGLSQEALYALLRAGLPSDKLQLARVSVGAVGQALAKAVDDGIVKLSDQQIAEAKAQFETFARETGLAVPAPGSRSTYGDLLRAANLNDEARTKFASVYLDHRGDGAQLWEKARDAGIADNDIQALQRQGKLAYLTLNNAAMTTRLQQEMGISDPVQLVGQDFYRADKWEAEVKALAGNDAQRLEALIPPTYGSDTVEKRLSAYAEDMARKVRFSYSTQVVGRMIEQDAADQFKLGAARPRVATFLKSASAQGFKLGQTPVESFVKAQPQVLDGIDPNDVEATKQSVKTLQRVYQITPSDEAMTVLLDLGFTSAYDVVAIPHDVFVDRYGHRFPLPRQAELVYSKAEQVSAVTYNLFTIAKKLDSEAPVHVISPPAQVKESVKNELIKQFPTVESLFGSLDFCECEHCRSVLSPAAYLVDLLQFLDPDKPIWDNFLADWKTKHNGQEYTAEYKKPYDALTEERRPDLPQIPLTCENTHTALPYIDVVNEILEYYVANGALSAATAHDTGDATTPELLAEPQHLLPAAYNALLNARYPLTLPFDLWLETVRRFCEHFETPLWRLLEVFRPGDEVFVAAQPYDRAAIFSEHLGLSPAEYGIFTNPNPLDTWFALYGYQTAAEATTVATDAETKQRLDLNSAKALSLRLGVTYKELVDIVRAGFVNPKLESLVVLYKLGVTINDVLFYQQHQGLLAQNENALSTDDQERLAEVKAFQQRLDDLSKTFQASGFDAGAWLNNALQNNTFDEVLVLADQDAGCNFDETTLRYASGVPADAMAFLKINLFVRLWRKLGWTMEETDRVLQAFVPKNAPFNQANLNKAPLKTALLYLAHLKALDEQVKVGKQSRLKLITLWSQMATTGRQPLYAQLFLSRTVLKTDAAFDDPLGRYLSKPGVLIKDHTLALQGALGLTADDIARILMDSGTDPATAELTLGTVSLLYRYGLLAKALNMSVRDLIALKQLSGLDPFKPLRDDPVTKLEEDLPFTQTLRFVEVAEEVAASGLKVENLDYLLRHRFDPTGKYRPDSQAMLALVKALAGGIRAIRAEHAVPDDPGVLTEDLLRQKLGLALPADVVDRFLAMLNGTAEFTATRAGVQQADRLDPATFAGEPSVREVSYNTARQEQQLTFRGVLFDNQKNDLKATFPSPVLAGLLDDVQGQARTFFVKYLQRQAPNVQPAFGFLDAADFDLLFAPAPGGLNETQQQEWLRQQRSTLAQAFLQFLQQQLVRQFVLQTMTVETGADPALVEALLTEARLLGGAQPLEAAFTASGERGLQATFFASTDAMGAELATLLFADADTGLKDKDGVPLRPAGANSVRLQGYLEVPTSGAYRFYVALDKQDAEADLRFDHLPESLLTGAAAGDGAEISEYLELKPGAPYRFSLEVRKLGGGEARLLVQGETQPKDRLVELALYSQAVVDQADRALVLLDKALRLVRGLNLTEREVRYLLTNAADFGDVDLSKLPTRAGDDTPARAKALFAQFLRLAGYARLKGEVAGDTDDLIDVFEAKTPDGAYAALARITRREQATVKETAEAIFPAPAFSNELAVKRLWEALQVVERFGVPVASIAGWGRIVSAAATPEQRFGIARDLKEAIKARFESETWQRIAQPIFDKLRQRQRDALVAHIMHQRGFARMEQLYEYFLIDPGMEPVVQTSRIRLAISSVQLFIQRCLLNLEKQVHPSVINAKQWEWMKRYRVWEANRKIFLFPENWLEPEFRDDKTHLFAELESNLLQGDVSNDLVEDAFLSYLKKLEELARLEVVGMYCEDHPDPALNTLHVIGRTYSEPHKYFYRRYAHQMWTPWEPVSADIEGDHLAPVVWRDRLYLFWVTFLEKANPNASPTSSTASSKKATELTMSQMVSAAKTLNAKKIVEVQLHWSEYFQGEWSTRESGGFTASLTRTVPSSFNSRTAFIHVSKLYEDGEERGVKIHLGGAINRAFHLAGRNSVPESSSRQSAPATPYSHTAVQANRYKGSDQFKVTFARRITTEDGKPPVITSETPSILGQGGKYTLLPCDNEITLGTPEITSLVTPIFYQDNTEQTFFVEPSLTEKTIEEWETWVTYTPAPEAEWDTPDWWKDKFLEPMAPKPKVPIPVDPEDLVWRLPVHPEARFEVNPGQDWVVNPATVLQFGKELVGPAGRTGLTVLPSVETDGLIPDGGLQVSVYAGSDLAPGSAVVVAESETLDAAGLTGAVGGLNVIGSGGLNSGLLRNLNTLNGSRFGAGASGGLINR